MPPIKGVGGTRAVALLILKFNENYTVHVSSFGSVEWNAQGSQAVKSSCLEDILHFQVTVLDWGPQRQGLLLCRYQTQRQKDLSNLNNLNNTAMTNSDKQTTSWIGSNRDTSNRNMTSSILGTPAFVHASASPVMTGTRRSCSPLFGKIYHSWSLDILRRPYLQTHLAWEFPRRFTEFLVVEIGNFRDLSGSERCRLRSWESIKLQNSNISQNAEQQKMAPHFG